MLCNSCGEEVNFVKVEIVAQWNDGTKSWDRLTDTYEQTMCDSCNSYDIDEKE
jgi:hypothetical protein